MLLSGVKAETGESAAGKVYAIIDKPAQNYITMLLGAFPKPPYNRYWKHHDRRGRQSHRRAAEHLLTPGIQAFIFHAHVDLRHHPGYSKLH